MVTTSITTESILAYQAYLHSEERSASTIENYLRHVRAFAAWLGDRSIDKTSVSEWAHLRVRYLRVQRRLFRADERALSREEYQQLLRTARAHRMHQLALIIETLGGTGIPVSELCAITVEAAQNKRADIHLKGKIRTILIPSKLSKKLTSYARAQKITRGEIFLTAGGTSISRYKTWADMKKLAKLSGVAPSKVFPHNLRHLFAVVFYEKCHDIARLADLLGHSNIETTRIYLIEPGSICRRQLERMQLVE